MTTENNSMVLTETIQEKYLGVSTVGFKKFEM